MQPSHRMRGTRPRQIGMLNGSAASSRMSTPQLIPAPIGNQDPGSKHDRSTGATEPGTSGGRVTSQLRAREVPNLGGIDDADDMTNLVQLARDAETISPGGLQTAVN